MPNPHFHRYQAQPAQHRRWLSGLTLVLALTLSAALGTATAADNAPRPAEQQPQLVVVPNIDGARGRQLFVRKGCVSCHSVKGVGGKAAPALDAPMESTPVNPLDFAARMWRGAAAMQELQSLELGYRIELTGNEIGDLAAFVSGTEAQKNFSLDEVPDLLRDWFIDEAYWDMGEWPKTDDWRFPQ